MTAPGDLLADRYRIVAPLGSGGMATVHLAHDERLDRDVAVKILLPNHAGDPVLAARFEREARSLAAAAHPGVVAVYDVDAGDPASGREPFFVMELCSGGSLADRLRVGRPMPPDELVPILVSVADGLDDLHRRGIVHRDLKPHNILFAGDRAKLADFGLARPEEGDELSDLTAPGTAVGTMGYLAPELLGGERASPAADIYALAVIAFAGLTGQLPRSARSTAELVAAGARPAPLASEVAPDLGTAFDAPLAVALSVSPADRPDALGFATMMTTALGRWSRSGGPARALASLPAEPSSPGTGVPRDEMTTAPAIPVEPTAVIRPDAPASPSQRAASTTPARSRPWLPAAVLVAVALLAFLAATRLTGPAGSGAVASQRPSSSVAASPSASPSPSPSASPSASAAPTQDPATAALDAVDRAISNARGGSDGLKGKEANELETLAAAVRRQLADNDRTGALEAARKLDRRIRELADRVSRDNAAALRSASSDLLAVLGD